MPSLRGTEEERRDAEREFEPMLKILAFRLGRISEQDRAILRICHRFRREAFHRGEINPAILGPVTELLFLTVVEVARKLPVHSFSMPGGLPRGENAAFLARFGIDRAEELATDEGKDKLRRVLSEGITCDRARFAEILSSDLVERIDSIVGGLSYLNNENDDRNELDHRLRHSQFWKERGAALAQECTQQGRPWQEDLESAYHEWSLNPGPRFTIGKLERWRREAAAIARATRPADALVKYWAIERRLVSLEDEVSQAVAEYDDYINMLVHDRHH